MRRHIRYTDEAMLGTGSSRSAGAHRGAGHAGYRSRITSCRSRVASSHLIAVDAAGPTQLQGSTLALPTMAPPDTTTSLATSTATSTTSCAPRPSLPATACPTAPTAERISHTAVAGTLGGSIGGLHLAPGHRLLPGRTHSLVRPSRPRPSYRSLTNIHMWVRISGRGHCLRCFDQVTPVRTNVQYLVRVSRPDFSGPIY